MEQVPGLIKGLRSQRMDPQERDRVEQIEAFIVELVRLSEAAIEKASRENSVGMT